MQFPPGRVTQYCLSFRHLANALVGAALVINSAVVPGHLDAQQRGVVAGTVRGDKGEPLGDVRVRIVGVKLDTVVRTGAKGTFTVSLPEGPAHFVLTRIGYMPREGDVTVSNMLRVDIEMSRLPQQLDAVNVREDWVGIRGVVGDDSTMDVLKGVTIQSMKRRIHVVTDSQGRFEFSLPKRERTSLTLSRDGYLSKPFVVPMDSGKSADVVVLMRRGADPIFMKHAMIDLQHRMAWGGIGMFVLDQNKLASTGELYLDAAIGASGMLARKGIVLSYPGVFLDAQPSSFIVLSQLKVADIEMVEVWGQNTDATRTLASRWPGGSIGPWGGGPWIAIWRKR